MRELTTINGGADQIIAYLGRRYRERDDADRYRKRAAELISG
jgi:hypothetical protein